MQILDIKDFVWTRQPQEFQISDNLVSFLTEPGTDLWQRTYYGFQHDNAPVFQMKTQEKYFTFCVKTEFEYEGLFEQCGITIYLDSDNWVKASLEYENDQVSKLGSVVTNNGYSDWASTDVNPNIHKLYWRLSRRESDYLIEYSEDGIHYKQMRIFHLCKGGEEISFGIYGCSPLDSKFQAKFSEMKLTDCIWQ